MSVFVLNFLVIGLWAILSKLFIPEERARDIAFLTICFIQLSLLNFFKDYSVGQDLETYHHAYEQVGMNGVESISWYQWEPGFVFINYIGCKLHLSFRLFATLIGMFFYYSTFRFIKRYSTEKWLSVLLFISFGFFFSSLHILRQTVAMSFILFSYDYIVRRDLKMFLLFVGLAVLFHYTSILFVVTYFLWSNKGERFSIIKFSILFGVCIIFNTWAVDFLMNTAFGFVARYFAYQDIAVQGEGYGMLVLLAMLTFAGLVLPSDRLGKRGKLLYLLIVMATCIQIFATSFSVLARICWYWNIAIIAFIPLLIELSDHPGLKFVFRSLAVVFAFAFFYYITNAEDGIELYATYRFMQ